MRLLPDGDEPDWTRSGVYQVAAGIYRIPLPLPTDGLRAVNVYALTSESGELAMIDSGWAIAEAREVLDQALDVLGFAVRDVRRFLVTHIHRDHYQMAVAVRREFGNPVSLGRGEEPTIVALGETHLRPLTRRAEELRRFGAVELAAWFQERSEHLSHDPTQWEAPDDYLADDEIVSVPARTLRVVATPGHTRGHVVFRDEADAMMFAGDHVLPHITPSIGFEAVPSPLPLRDYLESLRLVRGMPDQRLLPAHGPVSPSVHERVDQLLEHHARRLDQTIVAVGDGASAYDTANRMTWTRRERKLADLDQFNQALAISETAAHLDLLVHQNRLRTIAIDGVLHYQVP